MVKNLLEFDKASGEDAPLCARKNAMFLLYMAGACI